MHKSQFNKLKNEVKQYVTGVDFVYDSKTKTAMVQNGKVKSANIQIPVALLFEIFEDHQSRIQSLEEDQRSSFLL
jgi:hypothetical protein